MSENVMNIVDAGYARPGNRILGAIFATTLLAGGAVAMARNNSHVDLPAGPTATIDGYANNSGCDELTQAFAGSVGDLYHEQAFLPSYKGHEAKAFVDTLFDEDGPLSNKGDLNSLAAFMAVIASPANDGKAVNPDYNFGKAFEDKVARYESEGLGAAREDCAEAYDTAIQTAERVTGWANSGDTVTAIQAVRNENNNIIGILPQKIVLGEDLSGIAFKMRSTSEGVDGFTEVLASENDSIFYVKGITVGEGVKVITDSPNVVSVDDTAEDTVPATEVEDTNPVTSVPAQTTSTSTSVPAPSGATTTSAPQGNNGTNPNTTGPNGTNPNTTGPNGTNPNTSGPNGTNPGTTGPGGTNPNTTGPGTSGPGTSEAPSTTVRPSTTTTVKPTTTTAAPTTTVRPSTTTTEAPTTTAAPTTTQPATTTTVEKRYSLDVCDLYKPRNEGGFGVVVHFANLTASERDAILANPQYKENYNNLGDSNGDGQYICK